MQAELEPLKRWIKILSLTSDAPDIDPFSESRRYYSHPRLWDQYADRYRSVCLVFDQHALTAAIESHPARVIRRHAQEVTYGSTEHLLPRLRGGFFRWAVSSWPDAPLDAIVTEFLEKSVTIDFDPAADQPVVRAADWLLFHKMSD
jgi:hypothetical protein